MFANFWKLLAIPYKLFGFFLQLVLPVGNIWQSLATFDKFCKVWQRLPTFGNFAIFDNFWQHLATFVILLSCPVIMSSGHIVIFTSCHSVLLSSCQSGNGLQ